MARKNMTTSIENDLQKEAKKLAIDLERPFNDLIEEALRDLLKKYENKSNKNTYGGHHVPIYKNPFHLLRGGVLFSDIHYIPRAFLFLRYSQYITI